MSLEQWACIWLGVFMFITLVALVVVSYLGLRDHIERVAYRSRHGCFDRWPPLPESWPDPPGDDPEPTP